MRSKQHDFCFCTSLYFSVFYKFYIFLETLRKYPPLPVLNRICTKEYKIPGTKIILEKGTKVVIPVLGLQYDPEFYPDPQKFDPERFTEANKKKRHPFIYIPFGEGPRICIGNSENKIVL